MRNTSNANFKLPEYTDVIDIENLNENFETVDEHIGEVVNATGAHGLRYVSSTKSFEVYDKASNKWVSVSVDLSADNLTGTVPIAKGGTGATTAAGALTNLGITATAAELNKMDGVTATTAELNYVDGVTSNIQTQLDGKLATSHNTNTSAHGDIRDAIGGLTTRLNALADSDDTTLDQLSEIVAYIKNNKTLIDGITTSKVNVADIINNLTTNVANKPLSAAQGVALKALIDAISLSKLGVTATAAELNVLDGVTASTAELNLLDGATVSTAELNYIDGVTSNVQTQLNDKASKAYTNTYATASLA